MKINFHTISYIVIMIVFLVYYIKTSNRKKRFNDAISSIKEQKSIPRFRNKNNAISWLITQHSKINELPINLLDSTDRRDILGHCAVSAQLIYNKTKDEFWKEVANKLKYDYERGCY